MGTVVIVDDKSYIREDLRLLLEEGGHTIFAEAEDMETAKGIVRQCIAEGIAPVFVIDGAFPVRGQGEELARIIREGIPNAKIVSCSGDLQRWGDVNFEKGHGAFRKLLEIVSSLVSDQA